MVTGQQIFWVVGWRKWFVFPSTDARFYHSQMSIFPFTDAHLYVYRCRAVALPQACGSFTAAVRQLYHRPVVDVRIFIEKRYGLGSSLIMTKLGTLRSQFMKSSVYKGEIPIYTERRFSFPEIRLYLHSTALLQHGKWVNIHDIRKIPTGNIRWPQITPSCP